MKKTVTFALVCALILTAFSGCAKNSDESKATPLPVATPNPDITNTEGRFYTVNGDELMAEGGLAVLGEDFLKLMIDGKKVEFALSTNAIKQIEWYNKDENDLKIKQGTMLLINYTKKNFTYVAESIELLQAN